MWEIYGESIDRWMETVVKGGAFPTPAKLRSITTGWVANQFQFLQFLQFLSFSSETITVIKYITLDLI